MKNDKILKQHFKKLRNTGVKLKDKKTFKAD